MHAQREPVVGPRHDGRREPRATLFPRSQVERLVAEEDVVGKGRAREPGLRVAPGDLSRVRLPLEERRRPLPGPPDLGDEQGSDGNGGERRRPPCQPDPRRGDRDRKERCEKDQVARLRCRRAAEPCDEERRERRAHQAQHERLPPTAQQPDADRRRRDHEQRHGPPAGGRVARRSPEVAEHAAGAAELLPAAADAHVEPARQDEVGQPEGNPEDRDGATRENRLAHAAPLRDEDVHGLAGEEKDRVRMGGDGREGRRDPDGPPPAPATLERTQEGEGAGQREAEEEAVHAAVDAVEEEEPARRQERGGQEADPRAAEPTPQRRDKREARKRERHRDDAQPAEPEAEVCDAPREQEVERRPAPLSRDVLDDPGQGVTADE